MEAIEFLKERYRMCRCYMKNGPCQTNGCPMYKLRAELKKEGITAVICSSVLYKMPEEAIAMVEKWSEEHPKKTLLEIFYEQHPEAPKNDKGMPLHCPYQLGYETHLNAPCVKHKGKADCISCWRRTANDT